MKHLARTRYFSQEFAETKPDQKALICESCEFVVASVCHLEEQINAFDLKGTMCGIKMSRKDNLVFHTIILQFKLKLLIQ